jgi:transposase
MIDNAPPLLKQTAGNDRDDWRHAPPHSRKGAGEMSGFALGTEIHARALRGEATPKMVRELGVDRQTVRRLLAQERPMPYPRTAIRPSRVSPYRASIQRRVTEVDDKADRLFQELKAQGSTGGYERVKLAGRPLRAERDRLAAAPRRFETAPRPQAQGDGGRTWAQIGGPRVRVQGGVMVLGDSRRLSVAWTREQTRGTLLTGHQHAFDWCGGLTEAILYDHPTPVGRRRDGDEHVLAWPPPCGDGAHEDGFTPRVCRPDRAQTKGQVASGSQSVKRRVVMGRQVPRGDTLNPMAQEGVMTGADQRLHGPIVRTPAQACLEAPRRPHHGHPPYPLAAVLSRKVAPDCLVTVETTRDSVPPAYVGRTVAVHGSPEGALQLSQQGPLSATPPGPTASLRGAENPGTTRRSDGASRRHRPRLTQRRRWR